MERTALQRDHAALWPRSRAGATRIEGYDVGPVTPCLVGVFVARAFMRGRPWLRFLPKRGLGAPGYHVTAYRTKGEAAGDFAPRDARERARAVASQSRGIDAAG